MNIDPMMVAEMRDDSEQEDPFDRFICLLTYALQISMVLLVVFTVVLAIVRCSVGN